MARIKAEMTASEIAIEYLKLGDDVAQINDMIATGERDQELLDAMRRSVGFLELTVAKDWWTNEDMTSVNTAISAGNAYLA